MSDHYECPTNSEWSVEIEDGCASLYGPNGSFDSFFTAMLNVSIQNLIGDEVLIPEDVAKWMDRISYDVEEACDADQEDE